MKVTPQMVLAAQQAMLSDLLANMDDADLGPFIDVICRSHQARFAMLARAMVTAACDEVEDQRCAGCAARDEAIKALSEFSHNLLGGRRRRGKAA